MGSSLLGIDHVALRCFDSNATERFYGGILGLPVVERAGGKSELWDDRTWRLTGFRLPGGGLLDFFEVEGAPRPPSQGYLDTVQHVAIGVRSREDLELVRKKLEASDCPVLEEQAHPAGRHSYYFADPNGYYLELTWRPNP